MKGKNENNAVSRTICVGSGVRLWTRLLSSGRERNECAEESKENSALAEPNQGICIIALSAKDLARLEPPVRKRKMMKTNASNLDLFAREVPRSFDLGDADRMPQMCRAQIHPEFVTVGEGNPGTVRSWIDAESELAEIALPEAALWQLLLHYRKNFLEFVWS